MTTFLWESTSFNYYLSSLVTGIPNSSASIIYLPNGASGLTAPGIITIDQFNQAGVLTPSLKEYISFTTVTSDQGQISGLTRGIGGSTAQPHTIGALVEGALTTTHWSDMIDFLQVEHGEIGLHLISAATLNYLETPRLAVTSTASLLILNVSRHLNGSSVSVLGISDNKLTVKFSFMGSLSGATTSLQTPIVMPRSGTLEWINVATSSVASAASVIFDINKNGVSIFSAGTRPTIVGAGTFVSTASIADKAFTEGDQYSWDFDGPSSVGGLISNFNIFMHTN